MGTQDFELLADRVDKMEARINSIVDWLEMPTREDKLKMVSDFLRLIDNHRADIEALRLDVATPLAKVVARANIHIVDQMAALKSVLGHTRVKEI